MAKKDKALTISIMPDQIVGAEIMKSGNYKYASVSIKVGDKEYMRISYEWQSEGVPEFVFGLMEFIKANQENIDAQKEEHAEEYASLKDRTKEV